MHFKLMLNNLVADMASVQSVVWRPLLVASDFFDNVEHFKIRLLKQKIEVEIIINFHIYCSVMIRLFIYHEHDLVFLKHGRQNLLTFPFQPLILPLFTIQYFHVPQTIDHKKQGSTTASMFPEEEKKQQKNPQFLDPHFSYLHIVSYCGHPCVFCPASFLPLYFTYYSLFLPLCAHCTCMRRRRTLPASLT